MPTTTCTGSIGTDACGRCRRRSGVRRDWRSRPTGTLHVIDALAGASGVYRFADLDGPPEMVVSGGALVGIAFGPQGEVVVASNETAYRF